MNKENGLGHKKKKKAEEKREQLRSEKKLSSPLLLFLVPQKVSKSIPDILKKLEISQSAFRSNTVDRLLLLPENCFAAAIISMFY